MHSLLTLAVAVAAAVGAALGDDCAPTPGQKPVHPKACCKMDGVFPSAMKSAVEKCKQKYPRTKPPKPPPTGPPPTPSAEMKHAHTCTGECVYTEMGLLTTDKQLDKAAVSKLLTPSDADLAPVVAAAVDKCFASYTADIDASLECKSGAAEFQKCLMKQTFLNCPSALWTATAECDGLKTKLSQCPNMPLMMGGGPRGPRP